MGRVLPILFNTDMVRAILREVSPKTVTRRIAKEVVPYSEHGDFTTMINGEWTGPISMENLIKLKSKYQPGDILYVRETWCWEPCWDCGMDTEEHNCCDEHAHKIYRCDNREYGCYGYKASFDDNVYPSVDVWHPSIHMPKAIARIWLKVTDVRVERLQDITEEEANREGIMKGHDDYSGRDYWYYKEGQDYLTGEVWTDGARQCFLWGLWDSTIKKLDLAIYGWDANPYVFVTEFERCEKPEPCIIAGMEPAEDKRPCIGYGRAEDDDEPCEMCKKCEICSGNDAFEQSEKTEGE